MKKIILILTCVYLSINTFSQNGFVLEIGVIDSNITSYDFATDVKNNIYAVGYKSDASFDNIVGNIYKISKKGEVLKNLVYNLTDTNVVFYDIVKKTDNSFFISAILQPKNVNWNNSIQIIEIDTNLNIIKTFEKDFPVKNVNVYNTHIQINGNEIICDGYYHAEDIYNRDRYIYKLNTQGDSLNFIKYDNCDIYDVESFDNNNFFVVGLGFENTYWSINKMNYNNFLIDSVYDVQNIPWFHPMASEGADICKFTDSTFLFFAVDQNININLSEIDTAFNILKTKLIPIQYYNVVGMNCLAFDGENIFIFTSGFLSPYAVVKLDKNFNLIWQKTINLSNLYTSMSITPSFDGGCYVLGSKIGINSEINTLVVKLDAAGNYTNIENNEFETSNILVYPNPANLQLNIKLSSETNNSTFEIYNITGQKILTQNLENTQTQINIESLQQGIYIYKCFDNNKIIETGKFVKQ